MGLSASVFTTIYAVTLRPHAISFLLVIAVSLPVLCLLAFPFFNAVPFRQPGELPEPGKTFTNGAPPPPPPPPTWPLPRNTPAHPPTSSRQ